MVPNVPEYATPETRPQFGTPRTRSQPRFLPMRGIRRIPTHRTGAFDGVPKGRAAGPSAYSVLDEVPHIQNGLFLQKPA